MTCKAFQMEKPEKALKHINDNFEIIEKYGEEKYNHSLHTWDEGCRILGKCKECGTLILLQSSEYHSFSEDNDSYYSDYFPVSSVEEADNLNKMYNGYDIETKFEGKWLCVTNSKVSFINNKCRM